MKLTPQTIAAAMKRAERSGERVEMVDEEVRGLVLRISPDTPDDDDRDRAQRRRGVWSVRVVQPDGKRVRVPLGSYAEVSITEARKAAKEAKERGRAGEVVSAAERREAAREAARSRVTMLEHLDAYDRQKLAALRSGSLARRSIEILLGDRLDDEPSALTRSVFATLVDERAAKSPVAANRSLAYVRPFLKWLVQRGHLAINPATDFAKPTKETPRERTPTLDEVGEIWRAADRLGYPFGPFVQLLILTAGRRDEVAEVRLDELDLENGGGAVWTLPPTRSKNGRALRIPLAPEAVATLRDAIARRPDVRPVCPFVFSTTGSTPISGWTRAKAALDREIHAAREEAAVGTGEPAKRMEHWTLHDLRRGFATVAVDVLHLDAAVVDRCLNHVAAGTSSVVARVYQRSEMLDQRRAALGAWARLVVGSSAGATPAANVIAIGRR
ncbi:MAG: site-specific integrase [Hyphomicrobiales bacterium]|nr:site-specific integrase [Hyphomicrobiales bacterium]